MVDPRDPLLYRSKPRTPSCNLPPSQVVDARDPLLYRSKDLEAHAREVHASKSSFILLNKSDLLPPHVRAAWADYFDEVRVRGQADEEGAGRGAGR